MRFLTFVSLSLLSFSAPIIAADNNLLVPLTKRFTLADANGIVRADALRSELVRGSTKVQRAFAAYQRNTGSIHPSSRNSFNKKRQVTTYVELTNNSNALWYGPLSVGTPSQDFTVAFDTGSSDLFLPGPDCTSVACEGHKTYATGDSATAVNVGRDFNIAFGDGSSVSGQVYNDTVIIGEVTAKNQSVGAATHYSDSLSVESFPPDGLLGMAFQEISAFNSPPLMNTLFEQRQLDVSQFGFKLASPSELSVGGINFDLIDTDTLVWTPVTKKGFWQIAVEAITVNDVILTSSHSAIIDTGSSLIHGTSNAVAEFYSAIPNSRQASELGSGFYAYPCDATLSIQFTFDEQPFVLQNEYFNLGRVTEGSNECVGGVVFNEGLGLNEDTWLVGDVFLMGIYTAFDFVQMEVGFANLQSTPQF